MIRQQAEKVHERLWELYSEMKKSGKKEQTDGQLDLGALFDSDQDQDQEQEDDEL